MAVINTNISALAAQGSLSNVTKNQQTAMERLSTGLRINNAKDDAAGLSITNRMTSQIRGYAVAIRNSNDGISMTQTAEGALGQIGDMLQRMRELAVQSSNGSNSADNRAAIQAEVLQLKNEINNIAARTNHNDIKLLNGSAGNIVLQTGVNTGDTMTMKFESAQAKDLGIGTPLALTSLGGTAASTTSAISRGDLLINGVLVDQSIAQDDVLSSAGNSASAIAKVAAINKVSDLTGVVASVNETKVYGTTMTQTAALTGTITINGVETSKLAVAASASTSTVRGMVINVINAISAQTGVVASDGGDDNHGVVLTAADGRNITTAFSTLTAAVTGVRTNATYVGTYSLTSVDGSDIKLSAQVGKNIANADLKAGTYQANTAQFVSGYRTPNAISAGVAPAPTALGGDDLIINGVTVGAAVSGDDTATFETTTSATKVSSAISTAAAINRVKDLTGVTAKANANVLVGTGFDAGVTTTTVAATSIFLNGVTISANVTSDTTRADLVNLINLKTGQTGVVASDNGDGLTLAAEDGRTISLGVTSSATFGTAAAIGMATVNGVSGALASTVATTAGSMAFIASVTLQSEKAFKVESGSSGNSDFGTLGFVQGTYGGSSDMLNVENLDVSTQSGAMVAISAIDGAINQVSMQQSRAGAYQNRLDSVVSNLTESNQNMSASRSRVLDTDYAQETTNLAKSQIISQAATAMLAQANQAGQSVLALLK